MNHPLGEKFESLLLDATGAGAIVSSEVIQELWSGYGQIIRLELSESTRETVVVKQITMPQDKRHPRGWNSNLSHERKVFSYEVETEWYQTWSSKCDEQCRIPEFLDSGRDGENVLLILEDLNSSGYPLRLTSVDWQQVAMCLEWLAEFHATFMGKKPEGLWETGTYWHLATRPDELKTLDDEPLKNAASIIDQKLSAATFQTFVHGDAKLANFCFSSPGDSVSALDFQYVGAGCGMKDVAYFLGSCLNESECEKNEAALLDTYFNFLDTALKRRQPDLDSSAVIAEWKQLFPIAWTDFHRFLKGWCPGHWKINSYSERMAKEVIESIST
jgi:hypothetical protein